MSSSRAALFAMVLPAATFAESTTNVFECKGLDPNWTVTLTDNSGLFIRHRNPRHFDIPHIAQAQGDSGSLAYTLIGDRDTALVIIDPSTCSVGSLASDYRAHVLTQENATPIMLSGCCWATE